MPRSAPSALAALRDMGRPDRLWALAHDGLAPLARPKVNVHVHLPPNFSAFQSVAELVDLADRQGIGVLGVSNYYHYGVYADFAVRAQGIFPLFGLEIIALIDELRRAGVRINDPGNPGKMYICGKGITRFEHMTDEARRLIEIIRRNDSQRMAEMISRIAAIFSSHGLDTRLDEQAVIDMVARRQRCDRKTVYLQERHVAQAFQEALFDNTPPESRAGMLREILAEGSKGEGGAKPRAAAEGDPVWVQNEIRSKLMKAGKGAFVPETFLDFDQAYRLILEFGGVPVYPTLADGTEPICAYEDPADDLIERFRANRIYFAEFIPIRNSPDVLAHYVKAMRRAGLVVTAGTEHNTLEMLPLEPACLKAVPIDEELKELFWEGVCVLAAHQYLTLHGRCGFVDGEGALNPDYRDDEERMEAFSRLGAAVIERYYQMEQE